MIIMYENLTESQQKQFFDDGYIILKDFLFGFSTVNVEYDILLEKRGFGDRSVREKSLFFRITKKKHSFGKGGALLRTPTLELY